MGKYHCTIDLLFHWFGISCMTTDHFCFYLQNRLIQTSQTGGQQYSDTSPFSIPCSIIYASVESPLRRVSLFNPNICRRRFKRRRKLQRVGDGRFGDGGLAR
jgi:hypothetical protein